ncbi:stromal interaction molecule homolog isoform X1 [Cherax quadricarinatus]|uniref:stromal interaction molecule homolog isoform X1 n=1 Tax=Cherax quadricarinatus TaxID=27406 RepID=UPI00387E79E2
MKPYMLKLPKGSTLVILFCFVGLICGVVPTTAPSTKYQLTDKGCVVVDELCLVPEEIPNYEAIKSLHSQLDDDHSGDIDVAESVDFLKEELQYAKGYEKRQKVFHYNNDQYISVRELWHIWKKSEVHNWTVDQTVAWLAESVELQQYARNFYENAVNGSVLPRLAANNEQFLTKVLGIKDPKHRSKITIKAMDVVLFGPPKDTGSHVKDLVLVSLLTLALIGCFKAYQRNREYEGQLSDMLRDMEKLREAEENLQQLELKMNAKANNSENATTKSDNGNRDEEVQQLKLQLEEEREKNEIMKEQMKRGLEEAELEDHHWSAPIDLQHWLQLTYERERIAFEKKQCAAREQFTMARELCEKLNRQRRSLMGMLASVHGKMDNVDQSISQARTIMEEVTQELREREQRWRNIEILAGCTITTNAGIHTLELMLRPQVNGRPHSTYAPSIVGTPLHSGSNAICGGGDTNQEGASSYYGGGSLNSPGLVKTPKESMVDVRGSSGSARKRSPLIPRDSGSSIGSESSGPQANTMHHSHTYSTDLTSQSFDKEYVRRVSSAGSINHMTLLEHDHCSKDSNDSSMEETDMCLCAPETTGFSMGGSNRKKGSKRSELILNSDGGNTVISSQVSLATLHSRPILKRETSTGNTQHKHSPKRRPMLKSFSQDIGASSCMQSKERVKISASEPALACRKISVHNKQITSSPSEEGNSSDSSIIEDRSSAESRKKQIKSRFSNGILGTLKFNRCRKPKETQKD